jgi:hypothetical protein
MMNLVDRVKGILLQPQAEWEVIAAEPATTQSLYTGYIIPLAAIGPLASIIGLSMIGISVPGMGAFRVSIFSALGSALTSFVLALAGIYVVALVIDALAPSFQARKDPMAALKVAAYSATPSWLAGVLHILPGVLSIVALLVSLYGVYLLYLGLQSLMRAPKAKATGYTALVILAAFVIMFVVNLVSRFFLS